MARLNSKGIDVTDISIRMTEPDDLPAVSNLWGKYMDYHHGLGLAFEGPPDASSAWLNSFERTLGRFSFLWVAVGDGNILGFLLARLKRTPSYLGGVMVGEISDLYVDQTFRHLGLGMLLVRTATNYLKSQGVPSIEVQVLMNNEGALTFWRKFGFRDELILLRLKKENASSNNSQRTINNCLE